MIPVLISCTRTQTTYEKPDCAPPQIPALPTVKNTPLYECLGENVYKDLLTREIRLTNTILEQKVMLDVLCEQD